MLLNKVMSIKQKIINTNGRTNYMINLKYFELNLLKIDKKLYKNIGIYNIGYIQLKKMMIMKLFTA